MGNEGLGQRYTFEQLSDAIQTLRGSTGKPVTTAEQYDHYSDERLLKLGDWVFPTVHPYFYHVREPLAAVKWTEGRLRRPEEAQRTVRSLQGGWLADGRRRGGEDV